MKPPPTSPEAYAAALVAFERLHPEITIGFRPSVLLMLVGALQLALRHPHLPPMTRRITTEFVKSVRDNLDEAVLQRTIDMGLDPHYDVDADRQLSDEEIAEIERAINTVRENEPPA